jgi:hypothetical protein
MYKRRKRKLITEMVNNQSEASVIGLEFRSTTQLPLFNSFELENQYAKGKSKNIQPSRIKSFHFSHTQQQGDVICIESMLSINSDEWMNEYKDVHICKVHLLNPVGEVVRYMDFDVALIKYEYKLNYSESEFLIPRFYYKIFN